MLHLALWHGPFRDSPAVPVAWRACPDHRLSAQRAQPVLLTGKSALPQ
jgi:hypothetical protein